MESQLSVISIEWERVNLTIRLKASWQPVDADETDVLPILPGVTPVPEPEPVGRRRRRHVEPVTTPEFDDGHLPGLQTIFLRDVRQQRDVQWHHDGDGVYVLSINISNFESRTFMPNGTWKFYGQLEDGEVIGAAWDLDRLDELDALTRVFLFAANTTAYTLSFGITENEEDPLLAMRSYIFTRPVAVNGKKPRLLTHPLQRLKAEIKGIKSGPRKLQIVRMIYDKALKADQSKRLMQRAAGSPPKPRILFASEQRGGLEGNLLAVRDRMVERGLDEEYEFRYSFRTPETAEKWTLLRMLKELAQADIVLLDDYFAPLDWVNLNPKARYIQVWHAGSGFKSIGYSRFGKFGSPTLTNAHRQYSWAITGSRHLRHAYSEAFGIEESAIVPTGLPRIDKFLDPDEQAISRAKVYRKFPGLRGKNVILFAPTFRGRGAKEATYDYGQIDFQALYDLCGEDTVVAFRMHHFIPGQVPIPRKMRDRFIDVSSYREGNDLLLVTDLLITDYSSIIYEYSLLKRPMLFFAYDEQPYSAVRGFHRPYSETAPGKICHTFDELLEAIRERDFETWRGDAFRQENFDYFDSSSSDRVIDWLIVGEPPFEVLEPSAPDDAPLAQ